MNVTMVHSNRVKIENGILKVDRKFLTGMLRYATEINARLTTIHPETPAGVHTMDLVEVPCVDLPFRVLTIPQDASLNTTSQLVREIVADSCLLYGNGFNSTKIAKALGIPYILVLEYDLQTQITMETSGVKSKLRRLVRAVRNTMRYGWVDVPEMRAAHAIHCNGYPMFDEARLFNKHRLLYLDSRMSAELVIPEDQLQERLNRLGSRPLRLLFSGRYERIKGAADSVKVAIECLRRGLDIEMHTYGQGQLRQEMVEMVQKSGYTDRIHVHDAIPYPDLVVRSRDFDIFVCCHIQNDPSCTYLESFGAGLPIVGYDNRMWRRLAETSRCGFATALGHPDAAVDKLQDLLKDIPRLNVMSKLARSFALAHTFDQEFELRTLAINKEIARGGQNYKS